MVGIRGLHRRLHTVLFNIQIEDLIAYRSSFDLRKLVHHGDRIM
jgi:hypothetical protein